MNRRKVQKMHSRSNAHDKAKLRSPNVFKSPKGKAKIDRKPPAKCTKKILSKAESHFYDASDKDSLFISLRDLPRDRKQQQNHQKPRKKDLKVVESNKVLEESTASREFKHYLKQYNSPNGQYFGSRLSSKEHRIVPKKDVSKSKSTNENRKARSLEKKIREYRRLSSTHRSESESLKSEISQKEMHRLKKIQSLEKMILMEQIMSMQEKRLKLRPSRQK